jgi:Tfp pilus assembly protein PilE
MKKSMKRQRGQALVEYIIIIVIVAIASLVLLGAFSDRIRTMIAGATNSLTNDNKVTVDKTSLDSARDLTEEGITD